MNCVSFRCARLLAVGALAAAVITRNAAAQRLPEPLDPATYKSPNGKLALTVDPSNIYGRYAGSYRVVKDGKEVWAKTLPFTLFKSAITDTGVVVGCADTLGEHGFGEKPDQPQPGDLIVAIIDPAGKLRLKQTTKRQHGRVLHALPFPTASGLVVDEPNDRLILRVNDYGEKGPEGEIVDSKHFFKNCGANGIRFRLGRGRAFETLHRRQGRPIMAAP